MVNKIVVIDGMGGGVGVQLITRLRELPEKPVEIIALGVNATATERMLKAGADRGATGENAIKVSVNQGDLILGPIGVVIPNSMMGEITAEMAMAILSAPGERVLLPLQQDHFLIVGIEAMSLGKMMEKTIELVKEKIRVSVP